MNNGSASNGSRFVTTLPYPDDPRYARRATMLPLPAPHSRHVLDDGRVLWHILKAARREPLLLLNSSWGRLHPDLLAAAFLGLWPRRWRPRTILAGCMWQPGRGWRRCLERLAVRLADRGIDRYAVQSTAELRTFPQLWSVDPAKMRRALYFFTFDETLAPADPADGDGYIFAGGNSHRDYDPLVEAARRLPAWRFILATHLLDGRADLPPNVVAGPVSHARFVALMRGATAVVVPMRSNLRRAAGQQTFLNAMWLQRPTIVSAAPGVVDHVRHGHTGLVVDGSAAGYERALRWVTDPANVGARAHMGETARAVVAHRFTFHDHVTQLLAIVDELAAESAE